VNAVRSSRHSPERCVRPGPREQGYNCCQITPVVQMKGKVCLAGFKLASKDA